MLVNSQLVCLTPVGVFKSDFSFTELIYFVSFGLRGMRLDELGIAKRTDHYNQEHLSV